MEITSYKGFYVGQMVRLKSEIVTRPSYFNEAGRMDYLYRERPVFVIDHFNGNIHRPHTEEQYYVVMNCLRERHETWKIRIEDIVPEIVDNRRVAHV